MKKSEMPEVVQKPIEEVVPYDNNPRFNDDAVDAVAASIKEFGFQQPIVTDKDGVIIVGHTRLKAAKKLGLKTVPVIVAELSEDKANAYRLADNKTGELATWDFSKLEFELGNIEIDMTQFGFEMDEIEDEPEFDVVEDDEPAEVETRCKSGDLWVLGDHRLVCGDSTERSTFAMLMNGEKADISFTSPPYNADHMDVAFSSDRGCGTQKATQKKYLADNDKRTDDEYVEFLSRSLDVLIANSDEVFYNIGVGAGSKRTIAEILYKYRDYFKELMYWEKDNPMPVINEAVVSSAVELIICFGENNSRSFNSFSDRLFHGVVKGHSASVYNEYADIHKATFPVYLPSEIISRFTKVGGSVIDSFGGTGTTMIACEQLNRKCYMVELDPRYCDVILQRWENFTGRKAVRVNG